MRFAYVKPNNVVRELRRVVPLSEKLPEGGPDAYVAHFLSIVKEHPALIISTHFHPVEDESYQYRDVTARSYYWYSRVLRPFGNLAKKPVGTFERRVYISLVIFFQIVRFKPDHILCWSTSFPLWATYLASRACGAKSFVYSRHNRLVQPGEPWFRLFTGKVDEWIIKHASAVIVHGPYLKQQVLDIGVDPEKLLEFNWSFNHMLNESADPSQIPDLNENGNMEIILFIGRLQSSKGVFELLDACEERLHKNPRCRLVYAGAGSDLDELRYCVEKRGLDNKVRLLGMVPHNMLAGIIRQSRIVVTPTRSSFPEGRCMATMEGLVMGVPVIAPDSGPFRYLVKHEENGLLFQPDSVKDLKAKITCLLDDAGLYDRLCSGAKQTGLELQNSTSNYSDVVKLAIAGVSS